MAGVKYNAVYSVTTIDPPELVKFIQKEHPDVEFSYYKEDDKPVSFLKKLQTKGFPLRQRRWCCDLYKHNTGFAFCKILGIRAAESAKRANMWKLLTRWNGGGGEKYCLCPIIYWTDQDIWDFIKKYNIPYCSLYDLDDVTRLGCIACPMASAKQRHRREGWDGMDYKKTNKMPEIINDHFQNFKRYNLHKAQLIIADIPYNVGVNAYGSNPSWYKDGDNKNGESELAGKEFFDTDKNFKPAEFMHFCSKMLKKEPKERGQAPAMIVFCAFDQQMQLIDLAKRYGLNKYINLVFRKNFSAQVLKANMRVVGNAEYALLLYREKLPKFNNNGKMIFNIIDWEKDDKNYLYEKIHPTQKPVKVIEKLIKIFTDEGDIVIDPVAGSGSTLIAASNLRRQAYGFEIKKDFYKNAKYWILKNYTAKNEIEKHGFANKIEGIEQLALFDFETEKSLVHG